MAFDLFLKSLVERGAGSGWLPLLSRLSKDLESLKLRTEVFLVDSPFCLESQQADRNAWILGYGKVGGARWSLAVRPVRVRNIGPDQKHRVDDISSWGQPVPLLEAPQHVQFAAASLLPRLLQQIREKVQVTLRAIEWARLFPETVNQLEAARRGRARRKAPRH